MLGTQWIHDQNPLNYANGIFCQVKPDSLGLLLFLLSSHKGSRQDSGSSAIPMSHSSVFQWAPTAVDGLAIECNRLDL